MGNMNETERNVDIVFCIDATASMGNCIEDVKKHARRFKEDLVERLLANSTSITSLRVRLIVFRDYGVDTDAMVKTDFFDLTNGADQSKFEAALNRIEARGGGDEPENGLEALYFAMTSKFFNRKKDRQVIVLFTDTDALDLGKRKGNPGYPNDMVNIDELQEIWSCFGPKSQFYTLGNRQKRLVLFAPKNTVYDDLGKILDRTIFVEVDKGNGMKDIKFDEVISTLVASVSQV